MYNNTVIVRRVGLVKENVNTHAIRESSAGSATNATFKICMTPIIYVSAMKGVTAHTVVRSENTISVGILLSVVCVMIVKRLALIEYSKRLLIPQLRQEVILQRIGSKRSLMKWNNPNTCVDQHVTVPIARRIPLSKAGDLSTRMKPLRKKPDIRAPIYLTTLNLAHV